MLSMVKFRESPYVCFVAELQKASGLRVLRKMVQRQRSIEESDKYIVKELIASYPNSARSEKLLPFDKKRRLPTKLKPLF